MAKVEFRHVAKRFGDLEVIPDLNLTIEDGEFVALLGPSGCGKSTSLLMLAGIFLPSAGDLLFDGCIVNEVEAKDRNVGIVKGFRTPASHWRAGVYGGRRPKSLEGGNRGGVCAGGGVGLWGFSAGVCFDVSSSSREGRLSK